MSVMIQIRNVPDELHAKLKARAAAARMSLSDYLLQELERDTDVLSMADMLARLERRSRVETSLDPVEIIRQARGEL